jgi:predicted thioesterase
LLVDVTNLPRLTQSQGDIVTESLRVALLAAARHAEGARAGALAAAGTQLESGDGVVPPHPVWPAVGTVVTRELEVTEDDTAAAMGHPDPSVQVLGSPRISLWCELVSEEALPAPSPELTHVGAGILVHHLGGAEVGERLTMAVTLESVSGRRGVFSCVLTYGDRLVALATHHRVVVKARG